MHINVNARHTYWIWQCTMETGYWQYIGMFITSTFIYLPLSLARSLPLCAYGFWTLGDKALPKFQSMIYAHGVENMQWQQPTMKRKTRMQRAKYKMSNAVHFHFTIVALVLLFYVMRCERKSVRWLSNRLICGAWYSRGRVCNQALSYTLAFKALQKLSVHFGFECSLSHCLCQQSRPAAFR